MQHYEGFPTGVRYTPVPAPLLGPLLAQVDDLAELKLVLRVVVLLQQKRGVPRYLTLAEVAADPVVARGLPAGVTVEEAARRATARGVLLSLAVERGGHAEMLLFLNDEAGRRGAAMVRQDPTLVVISTSVEPPAAPPNIFALYEQVIGSINPIIADELKEAETTYPAEWIAEAFQIAAKQNARKWNYVHTILERWATDGRGDLDSAKGEKYGEPGRYSAPVDSKEYLRRYGGMARE